MSTTFDTRLKAAVAAATAAVLPITCELVFREGKKECFENLSRPFARRPLASAENDDDEDNNGDDGSHSAATAAGDYDSEAKRQQSSR